MRLSQMFQTEICECGKLKQFGKACKACGVTNMQSFTVLEDLNRVVAKPLAAEDDMEMARR